MKGVKDSSQKKIIPQSDNKLKRKSPPGGKSLARLLLFSRQRNIDLTGNADTTPTTQSNRRNKPAVNNDYLKSNSRKYATALKATSAKMYHDSNVNNRFETVAPVPVKPQWKFIGPAGATNGQTYGESRPIISGRVSCIAIDPSNSDHIVCGAASGGIWESFDRGKSWHARSDFAPTLTTGAIAFDPSDTSILYCGTGEGNGYSSLGAGLLRSTNGGANWNIRAESPFVGQGFYDLIVDPDNSNHILAAARNGMYESKDAGLTWSRRIKQTCWDITIHPAGGKDSEVFAACEDSLYRSTDGGTSFSKQSLAGSPAVYSRLAVAISNKEADIVYVFGAGPPLIPVPGDSEKMMNTPYLWKRNTKNGSFTSISLPSDFVSSQSYYNWFLAIAPDNADQIYLAAIEAYRGTFKNNVWSWLKISNKSGDDIHPDQHAIAIDVSNPNRIFVGNDGGLFYSEDRGVKWTSLNEGLGISEVEYMAQDIGLSRWLICGTQDNGTLHFTGNRLWKHIVDGDGGDCAVNLSEPEICYQTAFGMGMRRSKNKGLTWGNGIGPEVSDDYDSLFYPPLEVLNDMVAQAGETLFISRDQGTTWREKSIPDGSKGTAIALINEKVFLATEKGNIYRYTWDGNAWSKPFGLKSPREAFISDLYVDPDEINRIWAVSTTISGDRVFLSTDGGSSWKNKTKGLPDLPITSIAVHPTNKNRIWVGADIGVYQTLDSGATWSVFSNGLPNAIVSDLLYHPHARLLRAGLRNRGVWQIEVDGPIKNTICATQFEGSLAPRETKRWFSHSWPATWHMIWTVMPNTITLRSPSVKWKVQAEKASAEFVTYWLIITNLTDRPVQFEGRYSILSYY